MEEKIKRKNPLELRISLLNSMYISLLYLIMEIFQVFLKQNQSTITLRQRLHMESQK